MILPISELAHLEKPSIFYSAYLATISLSNQNPSVLLTQVVTVDPALQTNTPAIQMQICLNNQA